MPNTTSIMGLHLHYRLWIAEMNLDINVLRIFDDYLGELAAKKQEPEVTTGIENFRKQFAFLRTEIDELKHQMHIIKMNLAAAARDGSADKDLDKHAKLEDQYNAFRQTFSNLKREFGEFEARWLA
ncbi:MAG: hypothetical protein ABI921_05080 [Panacibacter sp.]